MNAREIAERIAFNYLREGGTLSELIERAILDGERLGQEQMREKAAQWLHAERGKCQIWEISYQCFDEAVNAIRSLALSTPEA